MVHWFSEHLPALIKAAAVVQMSVAILNLNLVGFLHWSDALSRMPLLLRQVFQVHLWFISITLAIFALVSWRFANGMAGAEDGAARWLAGGIGAFWGIRAILQVAYYSSEHWRGHAGRLAVHLAVLIVYASMGIIYTCAAIGIAS